MTPRNPEPQRINSIDVIEADENVFWEVVEEVAGGEKTILESIDFSKYDTVGMRKEFIRIILQYGIRAAISGSLNGSDND